ncbi:MAG: DUF3597 domain-containing protein [Treponema sp.]|nr:DUF3597 domain-containing protein [Treponema sp.]
MGVFSSIKEKLLGKSAAEKAAEEAAAKAKAAASTGQAQAAKAQAAAMAAAMASQAVSAAKAKAEPVDVEAILEAAVKAKGQKLNWRTSIVDLLKALDIDSSLAARKELAAELKYKGSDADGSAEKNIWLHKEVMKALAENGGKIPADLLK